MNRNSNRWIMNLLIPSITTGIIIYVGSAAYQSQWGEPSFVATAIIGGVAAFITYWAYERFVRKGDNRS